MRYLGEVQRKFGLEAALFELALQSAMDAEATKRDKEAVQKTRHRGKRR